MKIILFLLFSLNVYAYCPLPSFTIDQKVNLSDKDLLIVTHASSIWDELSLAKNAINKTVEQFKKQNNQIIYLQGDTDHQSYYYKNCEPDYYVLSYGGEFYFKIKSKNVTSVGGHWQACQLISAREILSSMSVNNPNEDLKFTTVLNGIYTYGKINLYSGDSYKASVLEYIKKVGTHKILLSNILDIINDSKLELEFLKRMIGHMHLPETHNVKIKYKNLPKLDYGKQIVGRADLNLVFTQLNKKILRE